MTDAGNRRREALKFDAEWLALRERLDRVARDPLLARMLAGYLPRAPRLLDLGAGTGSLFRFMAPIIGRRQKWIFADADEALLADALARTAEWARRHGHASAPPGKTSRGALRLQTPGGEWRIETLVVDLAEAPRGLPLAAVDAVVCSALLDLTSRDWLESLIAALRTAFYASMTVDGRDAWLPRHPADGAVRTAFQRDQRRDKGLGPALGSGADWVTERLLSTSGYETWSTTSDWRISRAAGNVAGLLARMTAGPARRAMPALASKITKWERERLNQAMGSRLEIRIGHRDILALPPKR